MVAIRVVSICLLICSLVACSTSPAPVIDHSPGGKSTTARKAGTASKAAIKPSTNQINGDWRPAAHTVKKGDTLYSIGLEYGYDYKDIAQINGIQAPYTIKIGQVLKLGALNDKPAAAENIPVQETADGVTTYPIDSESSPVIASATTTNAAPGVPIVVALTEPKAIREPYSDEAFKKPLPAAKAENEKPVAVTKPAATTTPASTTPGATSPNTAKPANDIKQTTKPASDTVAESATQYTGNANWVWPTKGKVIAKFTDAGNKGIDIAGSMGQSILATAPGKVIYSGSDLRGYGKLVIVKHDATYLSVYAHNSAILVKEGQQVSRGQKIAEMGNTDSNTVKLHFEIRKQGKSVDPYKFLAEN